MIDMAVKKRPLDFPSALLFLERARMLPARDLWMLPERSWEGGCPPEGCSACAEVEVEIRGEAVLEW